MALTLTGAGSLFVRIGHILAGLNSLNTFRGTTVPARIVTIEGDYASSDNSAIDGINTQLASWQAGTGSLATYYRSLARTTLTQMVGEAVGVPDSSLPTALAAVVAAMTTATASVQASVVAASITPGGSNTGNANGRVSATLATGLAAENLFVETVTGTVISDAQSGGATSGQESLTFRGQLAASDPLAWTWPLGSGSAVGLQVVSAAGSQQAGGGNWLNNSNFETFTVANIPDGWTIGVGTAGTTVLKSTTQHYDGVASLRFAGNGSELTAVYQAFSLADVTGDTSAVITPLTQFAVNLYLRTDGPPAAGVLQVALVDGSGTIINDAQGTANSFTVALTGIGTSWTVAGGFFRTPRVLPSAVRLRLALTTAITNANNLWIDHLAFTKPTSLYTQGPAVAVFSGSTPLIAGDTFAVATTNTPGLLQQGFDRLFGMKGLGYLLPSSGSPTISDSLIA